MMIKLENPCSKCELHIQGISKSCEECVKCEKRIEYVHLLNKQSGLGVDINSVETEIRKRKCSDCKTYFPETEENFDKHYTGVFLQYCKTCKGKRVIDGRKKSKIKQIENKRQKKLTDLPDLIEKKDNCCLNNFKVILDFSKNEKMKKSFENLKILAEEEIRTIEQQALYILVNEVERILNQ